jgi:hypothetical protein
LPEAGKEMLIYIEKAENHTALYEHLQPSLLYIYFSYLEFLRRERNFDTIVALYDIKILPLIENNQLGSTYMAAKTMLLIVEANLAIKNYETAGEILRELLNSKQNLPLEFIISAHLVELFYHYEKYDFDFLENLISNLHKKIKKLNVESRFLDNLLNLFRKIPKGNISDHKNIFQLYRTSLPSYADDVYYRQLNNFIDMNAWLDAQIRKQPYLLVLNEKDRFLNN